MIPAKKQYGLFITGKMDKGIIFDIKEFSIHDGPGIRVTVFMKGCPLRCKWCHNPEGICLIPQYNNQTGKLVGREWTLDELVRRVDSYQVYFDNEGGITFSGGEPCMQAEFLLKFAKICPNVHKLLDTSGYCEPEKFAELTEWFDMIYFDLKLISDVAHREYTGVSNQLILKNLDYLMKTQKSTVLRMPMIPEITDTCQNLDAAVKLITEKCRPGTEIHLLPYNKLAGGKYSVYGIEYPLKNWYTKNNTDNIERFAEVLSGRGYQIKNYVQEKKNE